MFTTYSDLTAALLAAVSRTAGLATVRLWPDGTPPEPARWPAATLSPPQVISHAAEHLDRLAVVRFDLTLWRSDADRQANLIALGRLADGVTDAVLADPSQGGLAVVGPNGGATEVVSTGPGKTASPLASLRLHVNCWAIPPDGLTPPPADQRVLIDGADLLASGPVELVVGDWHRRRVDRTFCGLDGVVSIDLGATHRPIRLAGRLVTDDRDGLLDQVAAVSSLNASGGLHVLECGDGRAFGNARLDELRWGRLLTGSANRLACIGYEMTWSQLGE
jgi:hypothetical protein